jgi:hypothetical protein
VIDGDITIKVSSNSFLVNADPNPGGHGEDQKAQSQYNGNISLIGWCETTQPLVGIHNLEQGKTSPVSIF